MNWLPRQSRLHRLRRNARRAAISISSLTGDATMPSASRRLITFHVAPCVRTLARRVGSHPCQFRKKRNTWPHGGLHAAFRSRRSAANPSLVGNVALQSAPDSTMFARPFPPRRTTFAHGAKERNIAINMPSSKQRDTWPHGGPRRICHYGIHMSICGRMNRYFRANRENRGPGEQGRL